MTIWHQGLHKCRLHPGNKSKEEQRQAKETVKRVMRKFLKMSRHKQAQAGARAAMEDGKSELAEDLKLYNTVKKDKHRTLLWTEHHSIDAVATVKKTQECYDRFHIYEVNDKKMNGQPSYVFKLSTPMAKIALLMDEDNPPENSISGCSCLHGWPPFSC